MTVEVHGTPNLERMARVWLELLARQQGMEIIPESIKIELKEEGERKCG